jgi:hypothetical protein
MLINQRCSYSKRYCVPSIEVSPPIISYEALRKSFSAQPLFGYAVQLSSSLLFLYAVNLFCRPRLTGNDSKYPCILYKLSDVFVKIHSQPYHFACSVYHYTSLAPLIFFCITLSFSKFTFLKKTLLLQNFLLLVKLNEYSFLNLLSFHLSGKSWFQFFQAFWCSEFFIYRDTFLQILLCFTITPFFRVNDFCFYTKCISIRKYHSAHLKSHQLISVK